MPYGMMKKSILAVTLGLIVCQMQTAFAYLDPGSGSMFLQLLLGGAAGVGVLIKMYWQNLAALFHRGGDSSDHTPEQ